MKFFEDLKLGETIEIGSHHFSPDEIIDFARKYDPQRFHLSEEGAADSQFGRLCASGWHTVCAWMKHNVAAIEASMKAATAAGETLPRLGPSPGFRDLHWKLPVFAGDTITYRNTLVEKQDLPRRPDWGLVNFRVEGVKQDGALVVRFVGGFLLERREPFVPATD